MTNTGLEMKVHFIMEVKEKDNMRIQNSIIRINMLKNEQNCLKLCITIPEKLSLANLIHHHQNAGYPSLRNHFHVLKFLAVERQLKILIKSVDMTTIVGEQLIVVSKDDTNNEFFVLKLGNTKYIRQLGVLVAQWVSSHMLVGKSAAKHQDLGKSYCVPESRQTEKAAGKQNARSVIRCRDSQP